MWDGNEAHPSHTAHPPLLPGLPGLPGTTVNDIGSNGVPERFSCSSTSSAWSGPLEGTRSRPLR